MSVQDGPLNRRGLHHVLGHMRGAEIGTPGLSLKLGLDINALFQENTLQEGILISQHQALFCSTAVGGLQVRQIRFMNPNRIFELLDIFSAPLSKCRLCLAVPLFAFFRSRIYRFSATFPLDRLSVLRSWRGLAAIVRRRGHGFFRIFLTLFFLVNGHLVWHDNTGRRRLPIKRQTPLRGKEVDSRVDARVDTTVNTAS